MHANPHSKTHRSRNPKGYILLVWIHKSNYSYRIYILINSILNMNFYKIIWPELLLLQVYFSMNLFVWKLMCTWSVMTEWDHWNGNAKKGKEEGKQIGISSRRTLLLNRRYVPYQSKLMLSLRRKKRPKWNLNGTSLLKRWKSFGLLLQILIPVIPNISIISVILVCLNVIRISLFIE